MPEDLPIDTSLSAKSRRFAAAVGAKQRERGIIAAAAFGAHWAGQFVHKKVAALRNRFEDVRRGLDTRADIPDSERPENPTFDDAVYYERISPRLFRKLMQAVNVRPDGFTFVDLGCGKGAALLLAIDHGFRSLVGVELNERLATIAEENIRKRAQLLRDRLEGPDSVISRVVHGDAVDFRFPSVPTLVYLYNPFGAKTMTAVLDNLEASLREHPREVLIAYHNAIHANLLDERPWLQRVQTGSCRRAVFRSAAAPV